MMMTEKFDVRYRLEITLPRDLAPHLAYRLAELGNDFAYVRETTHPKEVRITAIWFAASRDSLAAFSELLSMQGDGEFFPEMAKLVLMGPI